MIKLRANEIIANEIDEKKNQVLELAVNQETNKTRLLRVLPEDEALYILQLFIDNDTDIEYIRICQRVFSAIVNS